MILEGIFIPRSAFTELAKQQGITNPDYIDWMLDCFDRKRSQFIADCIIIAVKEIDEANKKIKEGNEHNKQQNSTKVD